MGSVGAMSAGSAYRYYQKKNKDITKYVPEGINVNLPTDIVAYFKRTLKPAQEFLYEEPPDTAVYKKSGQFPDEKLPEYYGRYILPATVKPNIDRIKSWVQQKKFLGKTQ